MELSVRYVVDPLGSERVRAERTYHVGCAGAENPAGKASNGPEQVTGNAKMLRTQCALYVDVTYAKGVTFGLFWW